MSPYVNVLSVRRPKLTAQVHGDMYVNACKSHQSSVWEKKHEENIIVRTLMFLKNRRCDNEAVREGCSQRAYYTPPASCVRD